MGTTLSRRRERQVSRAAVEPAERARIGAGTNIVLGLLAIATYWLPFRPDAALFTSVAGGALVVLFATLRAVYRPAHHPERLKPLALANAALGLYILAGAFLIGSTRLHFLTNLFLGLLIASFSATSFWFANERETRGIPPGPGT